MTLDAIERVAKAPDAFSPAPDECRDRAPEISVLVATRNRPDATIQAVGSILASVGARLEVVVVDQSDDDATWRMLSARFAGDARLVYQVSRTRGVAAARNEALALARAQILAITDDDCLVAPDWAAGVLRLFLAHPTVDLIFGAVDPLPHNYRAEFVPCFVPAQSWVETSPRQGGRLKGMGANMALRRRLIDAIGPFDERFGPGGPRGSAEDCEYHFRALARGHNVLITPELRVLHFGVRTLDEAWGLWWRDTRGAGALAAHAVWHGAPLVAVRFWAELAGRPGLRALGRLISLQLPSGVRCASVLWAGFAYGCAVHTLDGVWRRLVGSLTPARLPPKYAPARVAATRQRPVASAPSRQP
jgi:GT2 family glycosyltransferase